MTVGLIDGVNITELFNRDTKEFTENITSKLNETIELHKARIKRLHKCMKSE